MEETREEYYKRYAQELRERFGKYTDQELIDAYNVQVTSQGWVTSRGYYLVALIREMKQRSWDYSLIDQNGSLSFRSFIRLEDNKVIPETTVRSNLTIIPLKEI